MVANQSESFAMLLNNQFTAQRDIFKIINMVSGKKTHGSFGDLDRQKIRVEKKTIKNYGSE